MCKRLVCLTCFVVILISTSNTSASLVAHWEFEEGSGSVLHDTIGNAPDGTIIGAPQWVAGKKGGALDFNGSSDYVEIPWSENIRVLNQGDFSFAAWFKLDEIPTEYKVIFQQGDDAGGGPGRTWLLVHQTNDIRSSLGGAPTSSGVGIEAGVWYHAVVEVTEGGDNDSVQLYVNGEAAGASRIDSMEDSEGVFFIGAHKALTNFWDGLIDDIRIYNHGLSQAEITKLSVGPQASKPNPADGAIYENTWANLSWTAGADAASHDAYVGEGFDDVNDATHDSETFRGNQSQDFLVVGFPGFAYPDGLVPGTTYYWRIDEINDLHPDSPWKGNIWSFSIPPRKAYNPDPADGAEFVGANVTLSWTAGLTAKLHTVYFGDNFNDVNNAPAGLPQTGTTYDPGTLEMNKTYYWRVDEFDGVVTYKGEIWTFSTIPVVPVTDDPSLVLWWTLNEGVGRTAVDWSGYGHHGTLFGEPQWVEGYDVSALYFDGSGGDYVQAIDYAGITGTDPRTCCAWVRTNVPNTTLNIMSWGENVTGQKWRMRQDATGGLRIEVNGGYHYGVTSIGDDNWHHVAVTFEDDGTPDVVDTLLYVDGRLDETLASQTTEVNTASTGHVRLGETPWHGQPWIGVIDDMRIYDRVLSEDEIKQVMRIDPKLAWEPNPANGSMPDIESALPLSWSPGDAASQHDVYFGTDQTAVEDANASDATGIYRGRQNATTYTPNDVMWGGGPYYWRIDEINTDGTITKGRIWSFTVADFILVDDFESYTDNDAAGEAIWQHWIDGFGVAGNGAQVGYLLPPYAEQTIVHGGNQSMPLLYDNTAGVTNSEAVLALTAPRNWTRNGLADLSLWFRGYPGSVGSFVEAPTGTYTMTGSGADIWGTADQFYFAYKMLTGPGSIIARVNSVQNTNVWAKAGVMIRETLDAGSKHAFACVTPGNGVASQGRTVTDGTSYNTNQTGRVAPYWLKLERDVAGNFTVSHSANGTAWQPVANTVPTNISMTSSVYIGLAVTSHDAAQACQAVFSNVMTTGNVSGQWAHQDVGITSNAAEPMYVELSNANGAAGIVAHSDPAVATIDTWTEWRIPLQTFADQGVNMADVDSIAVGLGTKSGMASSGGSGTVYFDDIRLYP